MTALPELGRAAVVTIDMHRGHLDPAVATMPLPEVVAKRVVAAHGPLLRAARERAVPVVHVVTSYRSVAEIASNPWWAAVAGTDASRANVLNHQLPGSPGLELMPEVYGSDDLVVTGKKRYDCFAATDLEHALRSRGVDTLLLTGVNTNSCVLATAVAGNTRDFAVVVVEDCVDTMDPALHDAALSVIRQAFGWVATAEEVVKAL
ncbi:cysteine hydrolase family protein [Pseudonocardia acaciae]|uniref:cysteine hydrolase family protein n=1 Tax=Pseudonocardia acaciae TaxID=551276 RepID=UPI00055C4B86|nr:cysteine hydrolase [Pseudonocardia acaciae]